MTKTRSVFAIAIGLIFGAFLAFLGATELINSLRLQKRGVATNAEVVDGRDRVSRRLRRHSYYLTIAFQDAKGTSVRKEVNVNQVTFNEGRGSGATKAFYLPEDSSICAAGETVDLRYGNLLWGIALIGIAVFLILTFKQSGKLNALAARIEDKLKPMTELRHEYAPANLAEFNHLDLAFYDEGRRFLEQRGYSLVGDRENVTLRKANGRRTLLRLMLSRDKTAQAFFYHFKFGAQESSRDARVMDLQTCFSNGSFLCTSNAKSAGKFESPPTISSMFLPEQSLEVVLQTHERRLQEHLAQNRGVKPIMIQGPDEFQRVMDSLQKIKGEFRRQQGISKIELERISGKSGPHIDELAAILKQRWEQRA
jgi:hypothetical protein